MRVSNTTGILRKKKTMWFIGVDVEQEMSAPPPKKNPGSAPERVNQALAHFFFSYTTRLKGQVGLPKRYGNHT